MPKFTTFPAMIPTMIIATAGHVDHGKTSIIKALTGVETDRLKEEKQRGMTIELGFAYQYLPSGVMLGFVDVPGHEKLISTMLMGVFNIDYVLLVIAANEGIMPQTKEHFDILKLLNIKHGAIIISFIDLVKASDIVNLKKEISLFVKGSFLENAKIIPTSVVENIGFDILQNILEIKAKEIKRTKDNGRLRFAIDRCFQKHGIGTIVTGSVLSGHCQIGEKIILAPHNISVKIRAIHIGGKNAECAKIGDRAAFNLVGDHLNTNTIKHGDMLIDPYLNHPTFAFDAQIKLLPKGDNSHNTFFLQQNILKQNQDIALYHGTNIIQARIVLLDKKTVSFGEEAYAQIICDRPLMAIMGDCFIMRDMSKKITLGGGVIINPLAKKRKRTSLLQIEYLKAFENPNHKAALDALLKIMPCGLDFVSFCQMRNLHEAFAKKLLEGENINSLYNGNHHFVIDILHYENLCQKIIDYLTEFHQKEPDVFGVGIEKLRHNVAKEMMLPIFLAFLTKEVAKGHFKISGAWIALSSHTVKLAKEEEKIWQEIYPLLTGELRYHPPRTRDFAKQFLLEENAMRKILKSLARMGKIYEIAKDYFFMRDVLDEIITIIEKITTNKEKGEFSAADLRDQLNNGRKIAILLLEFFDHHGVTIRIGDKRRLNIYRQNLFKA